jgi:hypothetical protein
MGYCKDCMHCDEMNKPMTQEGDKKCCNIDSVYYGEDVNDSDTCKEFDDGSFEGEDDELYIDEDKNYVSVDEDDEFYIDDDIDLSDDDEDDEFYINE